MMFYGEAAARLSGGCIRFGPKTETNTIGIYVHHNAAHASVGIRSLSLDSKGRLVVQQSGMGGPIVTMGAWADESLVERGISLGCSGGTGKTVISVARNGRGLDLRDRSDYALVEGPYCNAWLFWMHLVLGDSPCPDVSP